MQLSTLTILLLPPSPSITISAISLYLFSFIKVLSNDGASSLPGVFILNFSIKYLNIK